MSTFDNPFDPARRLHSQGCSCGRHVNEAEHDTAARLSLQPVVAASEEARFEGVVDSAVMRAMFPQDAARRAFLNAVGVSPPRWPRCRNSSRSKPRPRRSRKAGRWKRRPSRSASFRSPAPRRSSWPSRWASMPSTASTSKSSRPPAGPSFATRRSTRNTTRRTCCRRCRSPSRMGVGSNPHPLHHAGGGEHQRPGDHPGDEAQGQARPEGLEGLQVRRALRLSRCTIICCAIISRSMASIPMPTCRSVRCRRRKWSPICAPTISTAISAPIR